MQHQLPSQSALIERIDDARQGIAAEVNGRQKWIAVAFNAWGEAIRSARRVPRIT